MNVMGDCEFFQQEREVVLKQVCSIARMISNSNCDVPCNAVNQIELYRE